MAKDTVIDQQASGENDAVKTKKKHQHRGLENVENDDGEPKRKKHKKDKKKEKKREKKESKKHPKTHDDEKDQEEKKEEPEDVPETKPTTPTIDSEALSKKQRKKDKKRKKKEKKRRSEKEGEVSEEDDDSDQQKQKKPSKKRSRKEEDIEAESAETTSKLEPTITNGKASEDNTRLSDNNDPRIVESSAMDMDFGHEQASQKNGVTLLLFYQYVEPIWTLEKYRQVLKDMEKLGHSCNLTGRMRVAREGLNCTLTSLRREDMLQFCQTLRQQPEFQTTEFKFTNDLPIAQRFPQLKVIEVIELVHYGLEGEKAPPIQDYHGVHLEPQEYHKKIAEKDTVMIDVRNHYEAIIGHFQPPNKDVWLDPLMRKSTEFPVWLDKPETKEKLKGKQVLMYCTGGIRCERATALLKYKMENDPDIKDLGIREVYQLQGGIDKYFKEFPDGGFWKGKNYVFDKRFAHKPAAIEGMEKRGEATPQPMSKCEACKKPWDRFRGKRRCPTCGVPSLICKECFIADKEEKKKKLKGVRCDLCVKENITSKYQLRTKEQGEIEEYEQKLVDRGLIPQPEAKGERLKVSDSKDVFKTERSSKRKHNDNPRDNGGKVPSNPNKVTRLYLKNMCRNSMDESTLMDFLPGITHIVWKSDGKTFLGQGWVEMATPDDAARALAKNGQRVLGRPIYINYQPPDPKDVWPPPRSAVGG